ncbi:MAG: transcription-repair coupling factor [Ruminococcaceae bacterium]|nr:transcription-repair coupling factor [Oscillospiraceae bacterium]
MIHYPLLCDLFRMNRQYTALCAALTAPVFGRRKPLSVSGLCDGAEQIFLAALSADFASVTSPLVLLFPDDRRAAKTRDFLVSLGIRAARYPAREYCFSNIGSSHDTEGERLCVLSSLVGILPEENRPTVITTTPEAVLQITLPPETLKELCVTVDSSDSVDTALLAKRLSEAGYVRVDLCEAPGQFAVRGGIVDIYPPAGQPVRIELFGDEVDRLAYFSPETQRFTEPAPDRLIFPPVRELFLSDDTKLELTTAIRRHLRRIGHSDSDGDSLDDKHARAASILSGELQSLENGLELNFADKYLPIIYPRADCLLEYASGPFVLFDSAQAEERTAAAKALSEQSLSDMAEQYELPPQRDGRWMREFDEILERQTGPVALADSLSRNSPGMDSSGVFLFNTRHIPAYAGNVALFREDLERFAGEKYLCAVLCSSETEKNGLMADLAGEGWTTVSAEAPDAGAGSGSVSDSAGDGGGYLKYAGRAGAPLLFMTGEFPGGFSTVMPKFALLDFSREAARPSHGRFFRQPKRKKSASEAILSYADLEVGDIVVHDAYGIGQYMGIENLTIDGSSRDYVHIRYAGTDKLFLPVDQLDHVSKYIGAGSDSGAVKLSKMGGADWTRAKTRAKTATREMAKELIDLYARRKKTRGFAFDPDDDMCREFADAFEYEETDGQLSAIADIRRDMEQPWPMDRLLCGDVGYGKTEVALRAAFKAVMSGKQVAVLVPTTILAYQHYQTFLSRMRAFPVRVDMVSRFRKPSEQAASVRRVARGDTDIIIGTHRLISKDVTFRDLGLIIIDEEQRFGVAQKEKLKQLAVGADVLTLTATPIPRTLNMAMGGIVDMSVLEDAPGLRSPVQTYVMEYDEALIHEAIRRELRRGGQVFYLFNKVEGIYRVADRIQAAIPDARIAVAHGKMDRDAIEEVWDALIRGEVDILVCTTIIETGVDIPNANTLIIENAENYGLAQLHQIRGRVGRSSTRAFAYFTYRRGKSLTEIAEKRLEAIREYAEFGAGFRIALRDLEIRGAGNLLGAEQHGHLDAVGYDLYMKLLEEAVVEEQGGEKKKELPDCAVDVRCDAFLSKSYIPSAPQRMDMYKRIARVENEADYDDMLDEMCDRFGEPDAAAVNLCRVARIRALGRSAGFSKVEERDGVVRLYTSDMNGTAVHRLGQAYPSLGVRVNLGQTPYIALKTKKNMRNTEFLIELLETYNRFLEH